MKPPIHHRSLPRQVTDSFDYEQKLWGAHEVKLSPSYLGALRLRYCLEDLRSVRGRVLEVGCGAGGMARAIKAYRPDLEVNGCDISRRAIESARANSDGVTFDLGNAYDLPFDSNGFDGVVMLDVLEHLDDPDRAIAEVSRVLRRGGLFHLFVPCEGALYTLHGLLSLLGWSPKERYAGHIQRFAAGEVLRLLEDQGLALQRSRWSGHLINQIVDMAYFTGLSLKGKNVPTSVEGYLETSGPGRASRAVKALKDLVAFATYYESRALRWLPGGGGHFTAVLHYEI